MAQLKLRMVNGTWQIVGSPTDPINMRREDDTWEVFGDGGGDPLKLRQSNGSWITATTSGSSSGIVVAHFYQYDLDTPDVHVNLPDKTVIIRNNITNTTYTGVTDANGKLVYKNLPLGTYYVTLHKGQDGFFYDSGPHTFTVQDPIWYVESAIPATLETYDYSNEPLVTPTYVFSEPTGWTAEHHKIYETWNYLHDPDLSDHFSTGPSSNFSSTSIVEAGWNGNIGQNDFGEYDTKKTETVSWYSLPIGMFVQDAMTDVEIKRVSNPEWASNLTLKSIKVIHNLQGYSIEKQARLWWSQYYDAVTNLSLSEGTGTLRYGGPVANTYLQLYEFIGAQTGLYTVPQIRNLDYHVDNDNEILWQGSLNDLGMTNHYHGLPLTYPYFTVVQEFDAAQIGEETALYYFIQAEDLGDPESLNVSDGHPTVEAHTKDNRIFDTVEVELVYEWF